ARNPLVLRAAEGGKPGVPGGYELCQVTDTYIWVGCGSEALATPVSDKQVPMPARFGLLLLFAAGTAPGDPAATPPPAPTPTASPGPVVTEIVVTGSRPAVENRVDRKIYAVSGDLQADLGSAADVLRNVPSVSIDIDGNPSLRGDSGVQILVDGR